MNFAIGFTEVGVLGGITALYSYGLETGGSLAFILGWLITFSMTTIVSYSMAEICGAFPTAGSGSSFS